jgi:adenine deaminase
VNPLSGQDQDIQAQRRLLEAARGERTVDLLLKNARRVNTFTGEIEEGHVAVFEGRVVGFGDFEAQQTIDLGGRYLTPGLMDAHMHLESSMVTPAQYARAVVPLGTTTVVADPHEMANVLGLDGIRYILNATDGLPLDVFVMTPSCVPATELETSGARLDAAALVQLNHPRIRGLGEMMDFPGTVAGREGVIRKISAFCDKRVDGHAPKLSGRDLAVYRAAGVESDHECTTAAEGQEKLSLGFHLMIREGSVTRDLEALAPLVQARTLSRCMLCTDDREPKDLIGEGHMDFLVRKASVLGVDPVSAITMASLNVAEYLRLKDRGAICPGYLADLVVTSSLSDFRAEMVFKEGRLVARDGRALWEAEPFGDQSVLDTVHLPPLEESSFQIPGGGGQAHIIGLIPDQIVTRHLVESYLDRGGQVAADVERDQLKLAVIERHAATGRIGLGLCKGFGLKRGAIASSVAHDSHNAIVLGTNDADMLVAARAVGDMQGGWVAVVDGKVVASLALPIAGLLSDQPLEEVAARNRELVQATRDMGGTTDNPFMALSFLALPVIPALKLTDLGLVDVESFRHIPLLS